MIALSATAAGTGTVDLGAVSGNGGFAVATINVGIQGSVYLEAQLSNPALNASIFWCETNTAGGCILPPTNIPLAATFDARQSRTFGVFVTGYDPVPFSPGTNRVNVTFTDSTGVVRGSAPVAARTLTGQ